MTVHDVDSAIGTKTELDFMVQSQRNPSRNPSLEQSPEESKGALAFEASMLAIENSANQFLVMRTPGSK
jgi:hypothetical protein